MKKKSILKKDENENQHIENNIKINIDLGDLKMKPEKKKKMAIKMKHMKVGANRKSSSLAPKPLGSMKMYSPNNNYNPNNNANMLITTALQNALGNRPIYNNNPLQPPALPQQPALPAPPQQLLITAPPQQPPPVSQPSSFSQQPPPILQPQPISYPSMSAFTPNPPSSPANSLFSTGFFNFSQPSPLPSPLPSTLPSPSQSLYSTQNLSQPIFIPPPPPPASSSPPPPPASSSQPPPPASSSPPPSQPPKFGDWNKDILKTYNDSNLSFKDKGKYTESLSKNADIIQYADTLLDFVIQKHPTIIDSIRQKINSGKSGDSGKYELLKFLRTIVPQDEMPYFFVTHHSVPLNKMFYKRLRLMFFKSILEDEEDGEDLSSPSASTAVPLGTFSSAPTISIIQPSQDPLFSSIPPPPPPPSRRPPLDPPSP